MRYFLLVCLVIACTLSSFAAIGKSNLPISDVIKFNHAVELLDNYSGDNTSLETAHSILNEVLKIHPRYAPAHRELGRYFIMKGHINYLNFDPNSLKAADSAISKAIEINKNFAEAYVLRGHLYRLMRLHEQALSALKKAEALGTNDPWLQNNWADLLIDEGKYEEAARRYRKVIISKTSNKKAISSAFYGLILYYKGIGNLEKTDEMYRKQIELDPNLAWGYGNYAQFLLCQKDDFENSIAYSRKALNIMNYGAGHYWLATGLYRKWANYVINGKSDEGKKYYAEARSIYPNLDDITSDVGSCPPLDKVREAIALAKSNEWLNDSDFLDAFKP